MPAFIQSHSYSQMTGHKFNSLMNLFIRCHSKSLKTLGTADIVRVADLLTLKSVFGGRGKKATKAVVCFIGKTLK